MQGCVTAAPLPHSDAEVCDQLSRLSARHDGTPQNADVGLLDLAKLSAPQICLQELAVAQRGPLQPALSTNSDSRKSVPVKSASVKSSPLRRALRKDSPCKFA